ncbi:GNAT family N-acetyltransferase [Hanstruepera marina]|uniref:GNAT family N-acetyltransferase n=1 Tax=Hanstruepera marina TaxID=2873265 RepID=UPI001CA627BF|nr:GNAT family N-acetyltransferase [Hanstruepera marina]
MTFTTISKENYLEITQIYEYGIKTGSATFETKIPNWKEWDSKYLPFARIALVIQNQIVGWAALSAVSKREVYYGVAEVSVYVAKHFQQKGIGTTLLKKLIEESELNGIWTLQSAIFSNNKVSIKMHENCGFRTIGYRERIGKLKDVWHDNVIMEKRSKIIGV